jgi:hypothetical protein
MPHSIAPLVEGWKRRHGGRFATPSTGGDSGPAPTWPVTELYLGGQWIDVSSYVRYEGMITITRGRSSESGTAVDPSTCALTLNNHDGRFSTRKPTGPYYGSIGRATPLRVSVIRNGVKWVRFTGEISSLPVDGDISGRDIYVQAQAGGILRRMGQGEAPLQSAMRRSIQVAKGLLAYWPMSDGADSAQAASAVPGVGPLSATGLSFAAVSSLPGSEPLPSLGATGQIRGSVPTGSGGQWRVEFVWLMDSAPAGDVTLLEVTATGTYVEWAVIVHAAGTVTLTNAVADGTAQVHTVTPAADQPLFGRWQRTVVEVVDSGSDVNVLWQTSADIEQTGWHSSFTATNASSGRVTGVSGTYDANAQGVALGHIAVYDTYNPAVIAFINTTSGYVGETAGDRAARLCAEEGVQYWRIGAGSTSAMGPQLVASLGTLLAECAAADMGILYEPRDGYGFTYRDRVSLYGQDPRLALDYAAHQLAGNPKPVDDDRFTRNSLTVGRTNGSSVLAEETTGRLSTARPEDGGVGTYPDSVSLNLAADDLLPNQGGWRLHLGVVDEARYPQVALNLRHSTFTDNPDMMNAVLALEQGDRVTIANPPAEWWAPDVISQLAIGYTETLGALEHDMSINCVPESPYQVGVRDDTIRARRDSAGSYLAVDVSPVDTVWQVATPDGPLWTTSAADFPQDLMVGGERVTVTGIAGASSPQLFAVIRSANGVVKAQTAQTEVHVVRPTVRAL